MDQDDLPPAPPKSTDTGFAGQLGGVFAGVVWIAFFLAIAGVALYFVMRWTGHSPW